MADLTSKGEIESGNADSHHRGPLFYIGAGGLLLVMTVETIAVLGRHLGWPLLGAIEVIQASILLSACAASVLATLSDVHASVRLVTERLSNRVKYFVHIAGLLLCAVFFFGLTAGSLWLASDYWHAYEESELLHIPFKLLRVLVALSAGTIACVFFYRIVRAALKREPSRES